MAKTQNGTSGAKMPRKAVKNVGRPGTMKQGSGKSKGSKSGY